MSTSTSTSTSQTINPPNAPPPQPQFSQINTFTIRGSARIIAITGQLSIDSTGAPSVKSFDDQVRHALSNLSACLDAAGATKRDIFKVTHHVVDFDYVDQNPADIFIEWLGCEHRPASAMLPVTRLAAPGLLYEIETWAIVGIEDGS